MTENEEELKSLLKRVKNGEKAGLKLNIKKKKQTTKIMASSPIISWQILIEGKKVFFNFFKFFLLVGG